MLTKTKDILTIALISLVPTLILWLPFFLGLESVLGVPIPQSGMATVVSNYDGPLYIAVAKSFYDPQILKTSFAFNLPVEYYAAHFPLFPLLISGFATVLGNFPYSMLLTTIISSIFCFYFFNKLAGLFVSKKSAVWLTLFFAVFPARWLVVRSVGSPEPLFIGSIIASMYFFINKKYWWAAIWGVVAQLTKSPGILLFVAYGVVLLLPSLKHAASTSTKNFVKHFSWKSYPLLLIPLSLLGVFLIYKFRLNDFWAYFNSGDNVHLFFPPFQIFNYSASWVGTYWLEDIIYLYLLGMVGIYKLYKQKNFALFVFVSLFFVITLFISHRDVARYALPIVPFLFIAFSKILVKKEVRYIFLLLLLPIYLFALGFISGNTMQISDWTPLL